MLMFTLTELTGKKSQEHRTVVVGSAEMSRRVWWIGVLSAIPGVFLALVFAPLVGQAAIFIVPIVVGAAMWLFNTRSPQGMQLRRHQALMDLARSEDGKFFICGREFSPDPDQYRVLAQNAVPVHDADRTELIAHQRELTTRDYLVRIRDSDHPQHRAWRRVQWPQTDNVEEEVFG